MRATSTVVVLSSLLITASVAAGPNDKPDTTGGAKTGAAKTDAKTSPKADPKTDAKAPATTGAAPGGASTPATPPAEPAGPPTPVPDLATVKPEDMPTAVRMRRLEQKTQALKERAWQLKARVQMLKENMLGGGAGAQAVIAHNSEMGASFRLVKLIYTLDGTQVFARTDETGESLYKSKGFDVFAGPISPGNHTVSAVATYRGHGYGVFEYLSKYTFTARGNQAFIAAIECKVTQVQPEKPPEPNAAVPAPAAPTTAAASSPSAAPASTPGAAPAAPLTATPPRK
jgi:hypothetical protein